MGLSQETEAHIARLRQQEILHLLRDQGPMSSIRLKNKFKTGRGNIVKDIDQLRARGHDIRTSMTTEDGMYVALFTLKQ